MLGNLAGGPRLHFFFVSLFLTMVEETPEITIIMDHGVTVQYNALQLYSSFRKSQRLLALFIQNMAIIKM